MGAQMPDTWFEKLTMPPTLPTSLRLAMSEGSDQPTAACGRQPTDRQADPHQGLRGGVRAAPRPECPARSRRRR